MDPQAVEVPDEGEWTSRRDSGAKAVDTLNRFLGGLVRETWDDLDRALRITENVPDFSGILPSGGPGPTTLPQQARHLLHPGPATSSLPSARRGFPGAHRVCPSIPHRGAP